MLSKQLFNEVGKIYQVGAINGGIIKNRNSISSLYFFIYNVGIGL